MKHYSGAVDHGARHLGAEPEFDALVLLAVEIESADAESQECGIVGEDGRGQHASGRKCQQNGQCDPFQHKLAAPFPKQAAPPHLRDVAFGFLPFPLFLTLFIESVLHREP